ncbi:MULTISPECIES: type II secretion system minor pseudopilin [Hyphobacterium]|uniref:General secretion pathway protein GspK n=1 Tax=Hyphobacterium vulgare TaxID=1736751 RepID=A0ABV6ZX02_9PROT
MNEHGQDPRRGAALVSALAITLTLATIGILILRETASARFDIARETERVLARDALETALSAYLLRVAEGGDPPVRLGEAVVIETMRGEVSVTAHSPAGKVDLNSASPALMEAVFRAGGLSPSDAAALSDAVADWRDGDDLVRLNGAEMRDYQAAGRSVPANAPFTSVDQFASVLGVDDRLYACLAPHLTVASSAAGVDLRRASPWLQAALGSAETGDALTVELVAGDALEIELVEQEGRRFRFRLFVILRPSGDPRDPLWFHAFELESARESGDTACPGVASGGVTR